jgi:hypothetical protein
MNDMEKAFEHWLDTFDTWTVVTNRVLWKAAWEAATKAEREACAKVCENISGNEPSGCGGRFGALDCADAIRKRND